MLTKAIKKYQAPKTQLKILKFKIISKGWTSSKNDEANSQRSKVLLYIRVKAILRDDNEKPKSKLYAACTAPLKVVENCFNAFSSPQPTYSLRTLSSYALFPHLATISGLEFFSPLLHKKYVFSASYDGLVHIYDYFTPVIFNPSSLQQFCHGSLPQLSGAFQRAATGFNTPLIKLRKDRAPITSMCIGASAFFTGNMKGDINIWKLPEVHEKQDPDLNQDDPTTAQKKYEIESPQFIEKIQTATEPIWELKYNKFSQTLLSIRGAAGHDIWKIKANSLIRETSQPGELEGYLVNKTCGCWINSDVRKYLIGLDSRNSLLLFERTTSKPLMGLAYRVKDQQRSFQPNFLESHPILNLIGGCFEDGAVRLFDPLLPACISSNLQAHNGPVNYLCWTGRDLDLISAGEDGKIKLWDLRMMEKGKPITEISITKQGKPIPVTSIAYNREDSFFIAGTTTGELKLNQYSVNFE